MQRKTVWIMNVVIHRHLYRIGGNSLRNQPRRCNLRKIERRCEISGSAGILSGLASLVEFLSMLMHRLIERMGGNAFDPNQSLYCRKEPSLDMEKQLVKS